MTQTVKDTSFSPYKYASSLVTEQLEDVALKGIRDFCLVFISTRNTDNKDIGEISNFHNFVLRKIEDLNKIKKTFELATLDTPFTNIGHSMDLITVSEDVRGFTNRTLYYELSTQIDSTMEILLFCLTTLERIIYEYNEGTLNDN